MSEVAVQLRVPVHRDPHGVIRVGGTRVTLDSVMSSWKRGATPEEIVFHFPVLDVRDVYAVCAWAMANEEEVDAYLTEQRQKGDALQAELTERFGLSGIRERLLARRA